MRKRSKKGQALDRAYKKAKIERAEELKADGKWVCIFTGHPLPDYLKGDQVNCHHLMGRAGDLMCDKKFLTFYINEKYHTGSEGVHSRSISELKYLWWFNGFLQRIKDIDHDLWYHFYLKCLDE